MSLLPHYGGFLHKLIGLRGFTASSLATASGVGFSAIKRMLNSETPLIMHERTYSSIANTLGLSVKELDSAWEMACNGSDWTKQYQRDPCRLFEILATPSGDADHQGHPAHKALIEIARHLGISWQDVATHGYQVVVNRAKALSTTQPTNTPQGGGV